MCARADRPFNARLARRARTVMRVHPAAPPHVPHARARFGAAANAVVVQLPEHLQPRAHWWAGGR